MASSLAPLNNFLPSHKWSSKRIGKIAYISSRISYRSVSLEAIFECKSINNYNIKS